MSPALTSSSCLDVSSSDESVDPNEDENQHHHHTSFRLRLSKKSVKRMAKKSLRKLTEWLLEVEMGFVWGVAGLAIITFVFAAIWYIDPALLTLVLRFRQARCVTRNHAFLIGISNCSWTSCRLGCTREIYQCWQIQVEFEFVEGSKAYEPPWSSVSIYDRGGLYNADYSDPSRSPPANVARLYPNVRGCGYPPELNCEEFYEEYKSNHTDFTCWVSTMDTSVAITKLDLERAKSEVLFSLIPLLIFIVFVLYAFCRMGVFAVCNPMKMCPKSPDTQVDLPNITPKKLLNYKRGLVAKKNQALAAFQVVEPANAGLDIPATIAECEEKSPSPTRVPSSILTGSSGNNNQVVTNAEVLPNDIQNEDDLSQIEHELFQDKLLNISDNRSETETVINELFGEELEKMDRDRLADKYDVLDLKELETFDNGSWIIRSSGGNNADASSMRRRRSKSPPADSLNSLWHEFDNDNATHHHHHHEDNFNILSKSLHSPSSTRAKRL